MRLVIMLIAQISDSHISEGGPTDAERLAALGACVDHINALDHQPALVVHTGDVVHNGTEIEYAQAADHLTRLTQKLWVIPGNKDHRVRLHSALPDACLRLGDRDDLQYVIDQQGIRLIMVDTVSDHSNKGTLTDARLDHIDHALGSAETPVLMFMHHPPFEVTTAPEPFQFEERAPVAALANILSKHDPLIAILAGHMHRHFETSWNGVPGLSMTAGALDLRKGNELGEHQETPYYCLHHISEDSALTTRLMWARPGD